MTIGQLTPEAQAASQAAAKAANERAGIAEGPADSGNRLNADFNFFLKMLTTQLQNQDPSEPMDVSQMTQQIATFSGVEQQVQTNTKLDRLLSSNSSVTQQTQLATASNYIGREVETAGASGQVLGGQGAFSYLLPRQAATADIVIRNATGSTVFAGRGAVENGRNILLWDGKNSSTGVQEPDGIYSISVNARNAEGAAIAVETRSVGIVSGFEKGRDGSILLNVDNATVRFDDVLSVRPATRAQFGPSA